MLELRETIPEEFFSDWAHTLLPGIAESPLDILVGDDGFEEFVRLIEGITLVISHDVHELASL